MSDHPHEEQLETHADRLGAQLIGWCVVGIGVVSVISAINSFVQARTTAGVVIGLIAAVFVVGGLIVVRRGRSTLLADDATRYRQLGNRGRIFLIGFAISSVAVGVIWMGPPVPMLRFLAGCILVVGASLAMGSAFLLFSAVAPRNAAP